MQHLVRIGTAGWTIPTQHAAAFPGSGSHLARYAGCFSAAEINSTFYRSHRAATYARWSASVPDDFRFAVKLPREITHRRKLIDIAEPLVRFLAEIAALGERLGPVLVQFPPQFAFNENAVGAFLDLLRAHFAGPVVCEPRHASWFNDAVDGMLARYRVARVAADPAVAPRAAEPGGWPALAYYRLHGSPRMYYSAYEPEQLDRLAATLRARAAACAECWCIFDNTARRAATVDALGLAARLEAV